MNYTLYSICFLLVKKLCRNQNSFNKERLRFIDINADNCTLCSEMDFLYFIVQ